MSLQEQTSDLPLNSPSESSSEENIPKLSWYQPQLFWKVSFVEILINACMLIYSYLVSSDYFGEEALSTKISGIQILIMYCIVTVLVPWYLGYCYIRYEYYYPKNVIKYIKWIFIVVVLVTLFFFFRIIGGNGSFETNGGDFLKNYSTGVSIFLIILGPMMGMAGAYSGSKGIQRELNMNVEEKPGDNIYVPFIYLFSAIAFFVLMMKLSADLNAVLSIILCIASFVGAAFFGAFIIWTLSKMKYFLIKINVYNLITSLVDSALPILIITTLIIWNEAGIVEMKKMMNNFSGNIHYSTLIIALFATGFIPFRIVMLFYPPIRIINFLIGLAVLVIYILSIS